MKEKLGVLNAESIDLKQQLEEFTAKTKQTPTCAVAQQQVASQEAENNELKQKIEQVLANIREIEAKHAGLVSRSDQLEDEQLDLHERHGDLSADYAEKNLNYSSALASGAYVAGGAVLGAGAAALGSAALNRSTDSSEEIPTASLDDFDSDAFVTNSAAQNRQVVMSPSESASAFDSSVKSNGDTEPTQTTESQQPQDTQQQQQFHLPFAIPHSETSSIQNNPSQSVRGDLDAPDSPTSTIEEENFGAVPPVILSSQIMPEGGQPLPSPQSRPTFNQAESFELVDRDEATIASPG
ncbi:unnamed protein product [Ambrosiozyma monospora]|uniref:Unnamed protein product n=1 Tax=Ambrosiozyma monospora TaxID=43982 RepID=A0ACB5TX56_AMBMO|nr:unnamed protein product [Ambrosiozyma monospora]